MSDLDLDAPAREAARSAWPAWAALLVVAVVGVCAGAGVRAMVIRTAPGPPVVAGRLTFHGAHLAADGAPVAVLRLQLQDDGTDAVVAKSIAVDGLPSGSGRFRLDVPLRPGTPRVVDLEVRPGCGAAAGLLGPVSANLAVAPAPRRGHRSEVTLAGVVVTRELRGIGGLCQQVVGALPRGWDAFLRIARATPGPTALSLDIAGIEPGAGVAGVWAGARQLVVPSPLGSAVPGGLRRLDVARPRTCPVTEDDPRVPTGLTIDTVGSGGLERHYAPVGPALARWLLEGC